MRYKSVDRVISEMAKYDLKKSSFFFYDDNFAANRGRTRELLEAFDSLPTTPKWSAQVRADVAKDEELLDMMAAKGCDILYIGLESINEASLITSDKRQNLEDVEIYLKRIRARKLDIHGHVRLRLRYGSSRHHGAHRGLCQKARYFFGTAHDTHPATRKSAGQ